MQDSSVPPVGVIGGGGSGLLAAAALRRASIQFELLEARGGIGGTWRYEETGNGSACYASLVANTSKFAMAFGGRRIAGRPWQYATHEEMLAHLENFADQEDLRPHIRLDWQVAAARPEDRGWTLVSQRGDERRYRAIVCAIPVSGRPRLADLPGKFTGEQLHSSAYRKPAPFADKRVLVLGLGTSGAEVAGEVASVAKSVQVSVRSPLWMMTRRIGGIPADWLENPRIAAVLPWGLRRQGFAAVSRAMTGGLRKHGLPRPTRRCGDDIIAISDTFPRAVREGLVEFRPAVRRAAGTTVHFIDGDSAEVDVIVHATGYHPAAEFLPANARPTGTNLFRGIAHTEFDNLFFVGMLEAHRALLPIAEDQGAWVADVLAGRLALPSREVRRESARKAAERRQRDFGDRHQFMLDHGRYRMKLRRDRRSQSAH